MRTRTFLSLLLVGLLSILATAAQFVYPLSPGDSLLVSCANALAGEPVATNQYSVSCAANTPTPTAAAPQLAAVDPAILGTCPAAVHDRYVVTEPDGKLYRTWHPVRVPIDVTNPALGYCNFAHEHGADPGLSLANSSPPAFGYIGALVNDAEPHEGFKVFVINAGALNNDGYTASNSTRIVLHMGTGGAKRFDTQFHSLQFDLVSADGHYVHVQGMADTGGVGSICASPRQGNTVMELPSSGCALTSGYEIWAVSLNVGGRATVNIAAAVSDPITVLDQLSLPGQRPVLYTSSVYPQFSGGQDFGCKRESYSGPVYWSNAGGATTFTTDAYGHAGAGLVQSVSAHTDLGIRMASENFYQMKLGSNSCAPGLGVKN